MLYYDRIDLRKGIDLTESNSSEECVVCHYWYFNHGSNLKILFAMVAIT